jgi:hypothetical protein
MSFKKYLAALFFAIPPILGMTLLFSENDDIDVLNSNIIAASPSQVQSNPACDFLEPIKKDLLDNLFENECGDTVGRPFPYYEHLSKDSTGSRCSATRFP